MKNQRKSNIDNGNDIAEYASNLPEKYAEICHLLKYEIEKALGNAESRIYYSAPVWFIDDIPIVGYNATDKYVNLLFWSGQSFNEPELTAAGKHKAAQIKYQSTGDVNVESLQRWLKKSTEYIWNYKDLPKTGKLDIYRSK